MTDTNISKRLVAAFVQFLQDEQDKEGIAADIAESIDVAKQCLHMAYATTSDDVPAGQRKLIDIFTEMCPPPPTPNPPTENEMKEADLHKQHGNELMKQEKFEEAVECYTKAIAIDGQNAVYYCNRAAAQTGRQKYDLSLTDCKRALEIDPGYSKAYSRMGLTYSKMEIYDEAIKCYEKALKLDPENEGYKKNMKIADEKQKEQQKAPCGPSIPGMEGMQNILSNPLFMTMAQQVMQNPGMQQMAMNMMSGMMGSGGGGGSMPVNQQSGEGATAAPDMSQILQMGQQFAQQLSDTNPELVEQLRSQAGQPKDNDESKDQ